MDNRVLKANMLNVSKLLAEVQLHLAAVKDRHSKLDAGLEIAGTAMARDFRHGRIDFGGMAQTLVAALRDHAKAVAASKRGMRISDARLGRALSTYLYWELQIPATIWPQAVPVIELNDYDTFRVMLAWELLEDGAILEAIGEEGWSVYRWTEIGKSLLNTPKPLSPDDNRLSVNGFGDLYAAA